MLAKSYIWEETKSKIIYGQNVRMSEKDGNVKKLIRGHDATTTAVHKVHVYVQLNIVYDGKKKVNCALVQALRLCTGLTAHRGSRGIALHFLDYGTKKGVRGQLHAPAALYPRKRSGTHCTGGWVGPRAGLDRCGKSRLHRDSIPGPSSR